MKLGMPAMVELSTIEESAALCAELGLSFLELNTNFPTQQLHLLDPEELRFLAKKYGIFYTIHLNDEMPVADFNPAVAEGYLNAMTQAILFAEKIGAPVLNMHLSEGAHYTMPHRKLWFYEAYEQEYLEGMTRFRDLCDFVVGRNNIQICIENSGGFRPFHLKALELLLQRPSFALTLDIGHDHCTGGADGAWILQHSAALRHMHIHDVLDGHDHHPLGTGQVDIPTWLRLASKQHCTAVLEVKTEAGLRQSVEWIHKNT
jgi:sugar phosphate isomerase/epimerase